MDIRYFNPWYTKYPNAAFMFQIGISLWHYIPIPWIGFVIRFTQTKYFQFGLGWGAQPQGYLDGKLNGIYDASLYAKFRFADFMGEVATNPGAEVYGYYEGTC
ncbi:MAG: hypothetical protein CSYNP_03561 [Syntrophus sp. SKADARSKE-3]|nr:hypothetical protein [Syntrophus sp. SKADARSKE-3]